MSVKVTVIPFSLFTAYQILSSNWRFDAPESKMRPSPSCVCRRVSTLMMEMIATSLFFVYCVSNFELRFYFQGALTTAWRRVTIQHLRRKEWSVLLCSDHIVWPCICYELDHMFSLFSLTQTTCVDWRVSSLLSVHFFSAGGAIFERFYHLKTRPHGYHSIHGFDHILDHSHIRSTRRQECTRVWKSRFCVAERAKKSKNG